MFFHTINNNEPAHKHYQMGDTPFHRSMVKGHSTSTNITIPWNQQFLFYVIFSSIPKPEQVYFAIILVILSYIWMKLLNISIKRTGFINSTCDNSPHCSYIRIVNTEYCSLHMISLIRPNLNNVWIAFYTLCMWPLLVGIKKFQ